MTVIVSYPLLFFNLNLTNMKEHKYFSLKEMLHSDEAFLHKISNKPDSDEIYEHLDELMDVLDELREDWGSPIRVNSGYRSPKLNKHLNGSPTSVHMIGYAVDMFPANGRINKFQEFVKEWFENTGYGFDQLIEEKAGKSKWCHLGLYSNSGQQRKQIKKITK